MSEEVNDIELEEEVDDRSESEDGELGISVRYTISSYGADYPVDGLVKRISRGDIYVPDFQRGFVWTAAQASRFIESLLLGLPVPGIFLFKELDTSKLVVVDGQQRLRTLEAFFSGILRGSEFCLRGVSDEFDGVTCKNLSEEDRRRLDDCIVHATVFQQDDPDDDRSSIYLIFERLNTGGTPLNPQEIRSCVYRGRFNDLLNELTSDKNWRDIYGKPSHRGKEQELILRFFALLEWGEDYRRPMKGFLNDYMAAKRKPPEEWIEQMRSLFKKTISLASAHLGRSAFRPERILNAAATDALLVGVAFRSANGSLEQPENLAAAAEKLMRNQEFRAYITSATTDIESVSTRLTLAKEAFGTVR
ncbi:MAG: DUF262 domain-containing protein [Gemmatimonadota bacterium]|nr:DUF262 domain-containing protein [Gemmatimonadota bacterium]